jgi:hypothetical protein
MIQEVFQRWLNATAPTAGHQGYAPALPHQQNAFGNLGQTVLDNDSVDTVTTQVAALTYQSQVTTSTVATSSQHAEQQFAHLASQQNLMHEIMHQIIAQVNALSFNQSNAGRGCFAGNSFDGNGGRGHYQGLRLHRARHNDFSGGQFGNSSRFGLAPGVFAPGPPPGGVMPYDSMPHG